MGYFIQTQVLRIVAISCRFLLLNTVVEPHVTEQYLCWIRLRIPSAGWVSAYPRLYEAIVKKKESLLALHKKAKVGLQMKQWVIQVLDLWWKRVYIFAITLKWEIFNTQQVNWLAPGVNSEIWQPPLPMGGSRIIFRVGLTLTWGIEFCLLKPVLLSL